MTRYRTVRTLLAAALILPLLAGCSQDKPDFNLDNVTGKMPDLKFRMTDARGQTLTADDLKGKAVLLYFGYTHCPDVCPMTLSRIKSALDKLPDDEADRTAVIFVSVDPARDNPKHLRSYLANFHLPNAYGVVGKGDGYQALKKRFHIFVKLQKDGPDDTDYQVQHSSQVYIFDPEGRIRLLATLAGGNPDSPKALSEDLDKLL
ncbi:MAG TPA: SCO family protein [Gammaproteobacteria bacterium]|nr:SCO family protein [Gammaproteobacteria bacterium]